jgi:Ni,Fe-hydrogenase III small subunit
MKKIIAILFVFTLFAANLPAQPQYYNYNNVGTSSNTFPFGQSAGKAVNWLFLPGDFNQPTPLPPGQRITKVYFFITTGGTRTFTHLQILMAQASGLTTLTSGQFYPGPWDTVYSKDVSLTGPTNGWMSIELDKPFVYDPAKSLALFVGQCGATGSGIYVRQNTLANIRRVWSVGGCPFVPYAGGDGAIINFGVDVEPVAPDHYNYNTTGGDNSFPLNQSVGKMVQWLVGPGEYNQPTPALGGGSITGLYFRISGTYPLGPLVYVNFNIRLGQTTITSLPSGAFYSGTMDTVFHRDTLGVQQAVNTWLYFPLDDPFPYNPAQSLVVEVGQCGGYGTFAGYSLTHTNITGSNRRVWSVGGCPFVPSASAGVNVVNCGIDIEYPTGVSSNNHVPGEYKLGQNYPNPFNPSTTISYSLPKAGDVKLVVFDMLGREVATLVNGFVDAGNHSVDFDASNLSSGVYMYKIQAGDFTDTKKMVLMK